MIVNKPMWWPATGMFLIHILLNKKMRLIDENQRWLDWIELRDERLLRLRKSSIKMDGIVGMEKLFWRASPDWLHLNWLVNFTRSNQDGQQQSSVWFSGGNFFKKEKPNSVRSSRGHDCYCVQSLGQSLLVSSTLLCTRVCFQPEEEEEEREKREREENTNHSGKEHTLAAATAHLVMNRFSGSEQKDLLLLSCFSIHWESNNNFWGERGLRGEFELF